MSKSAKNLIAIIIIGVIVVLSMWFSGGHGGIVSSVSSHAAAVAAGVHLPADNFAVLGSTYTNTSATTINGDLGYTTGPGVAPTVNGTTHVADGAYTQAGIDQGSALAALNAEVCDFTIVGATDLNTLPQPLVPGVYCITGAVSIGTGGVGGTGVTLTGSGTYIFRMSGALTTNANSIVTLSPGVSACDVFWTPGAATTLGANSTFMGTDIDASGITIGSTVNWTGRALAFGGTITSNTDTITAPACAAPTVSGGGGRIIRTPIVPLIGILKVPEPLALPQGRGPVTYTYTVWNVGGKQALTDIHVTDDKCNRPEFISGDPNHNGKLDIAEKWLYSCTMELATTTTNTAIATGYSDDAFYHQYAVASAEATVVVGSPLPAPLINIVKVPSRLTPFSFGGGNVVYTYTVTNPGIVPMHDVGVTDDKCSPVTRVSGDINNDNLFDPSETWTFSCQTNILVSTKNIATAKGSANGLTALGYAFATVLVSAPGLPATGISPPNNISWTIVILSGIIAILLFYIVRQKHKPIA